MKKFIIISAIIAVCSCSKEQKVELLTTNDNNGVVSFSATFEGAVDPETKVGINTTSGYLYWVDGDAIAVELTDGTFATFTLNTSTMKFTASLGDKKVKDGGKAYYPASIATSSTSVTLPDTYAASVTDGVAVVKCPMVGTVNLGASTLNLTHLGGILSIAVSHVPADATKMILTATGKDVTGTFSVADSKITAGTTGTNKTVTLTFNAGDFGSTATEFFIPVPVTTFSGGFTVDFQNASSQSLYSNTTSKKTIAVDRAKIKRMEALTVPISIYVRNNSTNWTTFMAYYSSSTYTTSTWSTNEISDFTTTYTHGSNNYYRFTLPTTETTSTTCRIAFHDSEDDTVGRVDLSGLTLGNDRYYTISGDGAWRVYVCDGLSWSGGNLRAWKDGWECFTGVKDGVGPTNNGTAALMLEHYPYTFKYWTGIESNDTFYYQFYKSDNSELTNSYGISRPGGNKDIVFNAYYDGSCKLELIGTGHVATYTLD